MFFLRSNISALALSKYCKPPVKDDLIYCFQVGGNLSKLDQVGAS